MRPLVTAQIQSLQPYAAGKPLEALARERGVTNAIKLASNENPLGPSPQVTSAVAAAAAKLHRYPDAGVYELRHALATHLTQLSQTAVLPSQLVFGNGSNELLELILSTFCVAGDHVLFADPSFVVYRMSALSHNLTPIEVPLSHHRHDLDAMLKAVTSETRVVFIANPNNPTGTYVGKDELSAFLQALPADVIPVLDEAYAEYATASDYPDGLRLRDVSPRLVVLRTFSKAYGLAGLRLGYAIAAEEMSGYMDRVRAPFNANSLAQVAALAAIADQEHLARCRQVNTEQRDRVTTELRALGLEVVESQANFVLVLFGQPAAPLFEKLLDLGVITRRVPVGEDALRITIGSPEENTRLIQALEEVLG